MIRIRLKIIFIFLTAFTIQGWSQHQLDIPSYLKRKIKKHNLLIAVFLGPDCPISQKYMFKLNQMSDSKDYNMIGIIPKQFKSYDIKQFKKEYKVNFKLISDRGNKLTKLFGAKITPETFLLDEEKIIYHGAIDNWFYSLGKSRLNASEFYLEQALHETLSGKKVTEPFIEPVGCFIEMK